MAKNVRLDRLAAVPLFSECSQKDLARIVKASDEADVKAGRKLTEEGRVGHEFFLILEGTAIVKRNNRKVAELGPGQYFGELSVLDRAVRDASVIADTDMKVLVLGQREFLGVLSEVPRLAFGMLRVMAHRLREADLKNIQH